MKKLLSVFAAIAALALTGCASSSIGAENLSIPERTTVNYTTKSAPAATVAPATVASTTAANEKDPQQTDNFSIDKLRVGSDITYPPFEYFDEDGTTPVGIDIELAYALGEKLGCEVEFINMGWDAIFNGLSAGEYDVIMSAVTITPDRLRDFEFSNPYILNYQCIIVLSDGAVKPADPSELAGLRIGYQQDTTSDSYINDYLTANSIEVDAHKYPSVTNAYDDMLAGNIDAVISDSTVAMKYLSDGSTYEQTWIQNDGNPEEFGICISKGNTELKAALDSALQQISNEGTLDEIFAKYF